MKKHLLIIGITLCRLAYADFAYDLAEQIEDPQKNWIFSPLSVSSCLSMVALGARGETADEMRNVLGLSSLSAQAVQFLKHSPQSPNDAALNVAQGMWVKECFPILPSYSKALQEIYSAAIEQVPFTEETIGKINGWIAGQTNQKIQRLLSPHIFKKAPRVVLASALYFSGKWRHPFLSDNTGNAPFYPLPDTAIETPFMNLQGHLPYFKNDHCQAIALSFNTESASPLRPCCLLILPNESVSNPLTPDLINQILDGMQSSKMALSIPKFKVEQQLELTEPLRSLGMLQVFERSADLSGIDGLSDLYLSDVLHKSFLSFDESGVEAAAATAAIIRATSGFDPFPYHPFVVNRPFYFVLAEQNSKTILFIGYIQNPCD